MTDYQKVLAAYAERQAELRFAERIMWATFLVAVLVAALL